MRSTTNDRILLTLGPLVDIATKEVLPATVTFAEATTKGPDFDPTPNQIHDVTITVSKVFFEGEAQAPILNRGLKIGDLQITRAPFAVSLVSDQPVELRHGDRSAIGIRNDSTRHLPIELDDSDWCREALWAQGSWRCECQEDGRKELR